MLRAAVTADEMKALEGLGQKLGISRLVMMENAGSAIANYLHGPLEKKQPRKPCKVVAIAGTGSNGGDVFVAVRHLSYWSKFYKLSVVVIGDDKEIHAQEALTNWKILRQIPKIRKIVVDSVNKLDRLSEEMKGASALLVGIFGTGFKGVPRELQLQALRRLNQEKKALKISVDIPSGMEPDTGNSTYSVKSDITITMHAIKKGMLVPTAKEKTGKIVVANIGLPF